MHSEVCYATLKVIVNKGYINHFSTDHFMYSLGKLKGFSGTDLAVHASKAALTQANISAEKVEEVFCGNVIASSLDAAYLSRHVALKSGTPISTPAITINRLCGSGFETVCLGAESIMLGRSSITICAGTENMSQVS